jgi:hypothetical protein
LDVIKILSLTALFSLLALTAAAQGLPSEPVQLFDGRVRIGGEISATLGARDDEAFFNYTDYERNALRTFRAAVTGLWQPASRIAFLGELRTENFDEPAAYAAYVRIRPWSDVPFDVQAGRIPPVFGAFGRRRYQSDQILVGYPLAYQYLTSLRADALPATGDDLLLMRGRGWLASYPIGSHTAAAGLPLISAFRWDTGVEATWSGAVEAAVSVTTGTLSNPRLRDDNGGKQIAARVAGRPVTGLVIGASASRGAWISDAVPHGRDSPAQTALGADAEYSKDHWLVRTELVWSQWNVPFWTGPVEEADVRALAAWVEGRYRVTPRLYLAARADRLGFSDITGPASLKPTPWDAPVTRYEFGGGYSLQRNLVLRAVAQINHRAGGRVGTRTFYSTQAVWWF